MRRVSLHPSSFALPPWPRPRSNGRRHMPRQNRLRPALRSRRKICRRAMGEEGGASLDHLVGAAGERKRDSDAERPGGLEIEDQLDFRGLHDREVSRLLALENAPGTETGQTVRLRNAASVAHQTAGGGELALKIDCWNPVAEGECAELRGVAAEPWIGGADHERGCSRLRRRCEGRFEVGFGARVEYMKPHAECIGYGLQVFRNRRSEWICGVDEQSKGRRPGE